MITINDRVEEVERRIAAAVDRVNRDISEVTLVAVSKTYPPEAVRGAFNAGLTVFGENRVQEARTKIPELKDIDAKWHLVGHLQTNKVKYVLPLFDVIESLDSLKLAEAIEKRAVLNELASVECLIQVNTSGEDSKSGVSPDEALDFLNALSSFTLLNITGFMTIGPLGGDEQAVRQSFSTLRSIRDEAVAGGSSASHLSMGMSGDFEIAIEEGATIIRVGSAIFGER